MAGIATKADLITAWGMRQRYQFNKASLAVAGAGQWGTYWGRTGNPGQATIGGIGNTTNGIVPTASTPFGFPVPAAGGGKSLWLGSFDIENNDIGGSSYILYDRLWHLGAISITGAGATTTFTSIPAITRAPSDWSELEIWCEVTGAVSNTATTVQIVYTNSAGTTGQVTNAQNVIFFQIGRMFPFSLAAGDTSIRQVTGMTTAGVNATTGTINIVVVRRIATRFIPIRYSGGSVIQSDPFAVGFRKIFDDSYLNLIGQTSASTGDIGNVAGNYSILQA